MLISAPHGPYCSKSIFMRQTTDVIERGWDGQASYSISVVGKTSLNYSVDIRLLWLSRILCDRNQWVLSVCGGSLNTEVRPGNMPATATLLPWMTSYYPRQLWVGGSRWIFWACLMKLAWLKWWAHSSKARGKYRWELDYRQEKLVQVWTSLWLTGLSLFLNSSDTGNQDSSFAHHFVFYSVYPRIYMGPV